MTPVFPKSGTYTTHIRHRLSANIPAMGSYRTELSALIDELMETHDLKLLTLEKASGLKKSTLQRYKTGESGIPLEDTPALAKAFKMSGWEVAKIVEERVIAPKKAEKPNLKGPVPEGYLSPRPLTEKQKRLQQVCFRLIDTLSDDQAELVSAVLLKIDELNEHKIAVKQANSAASKVKRAKSEVPP